MAIWIGTSGFQYAELKGSFYPETLSKAKMLPFYAARFSSTESNYTFRHIPSARTIERWSLLTPEEFRFSLKAPQRITHSSRLRDGRETLRHFHKAIAALKRKLGPVLFQLPPNFKKDAPLLESFLKIIPPRLRATFEFRHPSWFCDEVLAALKRRNVALCLAESDELVTPLVATADFGYLRLRQETYSKARLLKWADYVKTQQGVWKDTYIYFKHEETGRGPKYAARMQGLLALKS